ncbi:hypothetical protein ACYATO_06295 [Lactobacillaceae bacterium Melli_B3]
MLKIIKIIFKFSGYYITGIISLFIMNFMSGRLTLAPFKYKQDWITIYFLITLLILPIFRYYHPNWFRSRLDQIVTYKQKAMELHYQDKSQNHNRGDWTLKGVSSNPWEYTNHYTATYGNGAGFGYNLFIGILVSALFIAFAPIFPLINSLIKRFRWHS